MLQLMGPLARRTLLAKLLSARTAQVSWMVSPSSSDFPLWWVVFFI